MCTYLSISIYPWPFWRNAASSARPTSNSVSKYDEFITGGGEPTLGGYLDMPDNTASGDVWNPPDTESTMGISYDNCEAAHGAPMGLVQVSSI